MTSKQRNMLNRLMDACHSLGNQLDATATSPMKYIERQAAHKLVHKVLYGVLTDMPENDYRDQDWEESEQYMQKLESLVKKQYNDRNGN